MPELRRSFAVRARRTVAAAGAARGCVSRQSGPAASEAPATVALSDLAGLTLQVGDQKGGTESLLRAAGQLNDLPYQVQFSTFTSGPPQIEAATAGKIDFAITGNTPPIFGAAAGAKVKVVSAYNGGGVGDQILVHADSPITSIADLRGKSIAVGKGSSAHGHILGQLEKAGLTPADVKLVFLQPADALSAFTQRQADAWADLGSLHRAGRAADRRAQHRPGQGRHQRLLVRRRLRPGAGRSQAQHRAGRPAGALREGGAMGQGQPAAVGAELRRRGRSGPEGRRGFAGPQPAAARRPRRRGGGLRAEDCRPVRHTRVRSSPRRSSPTGSTAATTTSSRHF